MVKLEKLTVTADSTDFDSTGTGARSLLEVPSGGKPTAQRSLADLISASPLVTLRATIGDREESQISAVGQNNRYNSIQIDGARINDQFGLNMTGLASFFNPLSIDTIEQLSVEVSPYDVRQSGFTGATINAVTKSGANTVFGSVYYIFGGDELSGSSDARRGCFDPHQHRGQNRPQAGTDDLRVNAWVDRSGRTTSSFS